MFVIDVDRKEVINEFPIIKDWIKKMRKLKLNESDFNKDDVEFYYSYGFFVPKSKNNEEEYLKSLESNINLLYPERLELELSKVRVNISMKLKHFTMTDRLPKGSIPLKIKDIVAEVTKVKMMVESEYTNNKEVLNSIPALDKNIVEIEIVKENSDNQNKNTEEIIDNNFTIDTLLDKISKNGYESLSKEEKEFLDNKSKGL